MKIACGLLAGLGILAMGQAAQAAPPKVTGKYAYLSINMCQASFTTTTDIYRLGSGTNAPAIKTLSPANAGLMSASTGYITFTPAAAGAPNGTAAGSGVLVEGAALKINASGNPAWAQKADPIPSSTYSFTDTTFTLAGDVYQMTYGNVVNTFAKTVNLLRREGTTNCLIAITATKQP
jgi:hypothetical protein